MQNLTSISFAFRNSSPSNQIRLVCYFLWATVYYFTASLKNSTSNHTAPLQVHIASVSYLDVRWSALHTASKKMSCYSNGSDRPHRHRCINRSIIFARWRQCAPLSNVWFPGPTQVCVQTVIGTPRWRWRCLFILYFIYISIVHPLLQGSQLHPTCRSPML